MQQSIIHIPKRIYKQIMGHLVHPQMSVEEVAFIFAHVFNTNSQKLQFKYVDWYPVAPDEFTIQTAGHVELKDEIRPTILQRATKLKCTIIEFHSHISNSSFFSGSDLYGFREFVPHIRWRLDGKPYAAIVVTKKDFDALVWLNGNNKPQLLTQIEITGIFFKKRIYPNGITISKKIFI